MQSPWTFLLDFLAQYGGGRGDIGNELVRTSLAAVFWATLLAFALWRRGSSPRRGWRQRSRLSTPMMLPEAKLTCGW